MTAGFSRQLRFYPVAVLLCFCWRFFQLAYLWDIPVDFPWRLPSEETVTLYGFRFLGDFYPAWFPVIMLAALCFRSPMYLILAVMHFALFKSGPGYLIRRDLRSIPWGIAKLRGRRA
jgi:hypothetical protein